MKYRLLTTLSAVVALSAAASAQGLFALTPSLDVNNKTLPLRWTLGVSVGWDDNMLASDAVKESGAYIAPFISVALSNYDSDRTQYSFSARVGGMYYFDAPEVYTDLTNSFSWDTSLGFNLNHRFSERVSYSTHNYIGYQLDPNFNTGYTSSAVVGEYLFIASDHSIAYTWSDRWATVFGYALSSVSYVEDFAQIDDKLGHTFWADLRYQYSDTTVFTLSYRYGISNRDFGLDSGSHYILGGFEHRFSDRSAMSLRTGVQILESSMSSFNTTTPYLEAGFTQQSTDEFGWSLFVRYANEDNETYWGELGSYQSHPTLRLGVNGNYAVSHKLSLNAGLDLISSMFRDPTTPFLEEADEFLINVGLGFTYAISDNVSLFGNYNYTTLASDLDRDYDRNRISLGVSTSF